MAHLLRSRTTRQNTLIGLITALTLISGVFFFAGETIRARAVALTKATSKDENVATRGESDLNSSFKRSASASIRTAAQATDPFAPCTPSAANAISCENSKLGNPASEWDITGAGDANIQGFATDISVNRGETVHFKIDTNSTDYRLDIYRLGYYNGLGARKITTVQPSAALPQTQGGCLTVPSTGLIDCGNWAESASWAVPSNATSGIYIAKLTREDGVTGSSHVVFIVRDDNGGSDVLFQTSDTTWQAYNTYGGNSLYVGAPVGRAYKVSYNRPFITRQGITSHDWVFDGEYPMVRWLEANGYNVSYFTGVDSERRGAEILEHKAFLSVGHDEYWSGNQRTNVEAARDAGVHLAFFSGNLMFWKTRWENGIDASAGAYRTLVCYKETHANAKIDPLPNTWTGTWRDPRFSPPADGGRPENAIAGTIFTVNGPAEDAIKVSEPLGKLRFWRNTTVASQATGDTATVGDGTVGYEWDEDLDNGFRPIGLIRLSANTVNVGSYLQDFGSTYGNGTATHSLTLHRRLSGALVFSAATIRWSWGLDNNHDQSESSTIPPPDDRMRQATVNLLADMGAQPATIQAGLLAASQSLDNLPPTSLFNSPGAGASLPQESPVTITGSSIDTGGGVVAAVNISVDGGATWKRVEGTDAWSYSWTPMVLGPATIKVIAVDDSGNQQTPETTLNVTVVPPPPQTCPCTIWNNTLAPQNALETDDSSVELGLKFRADDSGIVTGVRFYKGGPTNGGTHVGHLWSSAGALLGTVTFIGETASGWQQAMFDTPIPVTANTTYVVSYFAPMGHYPADENYFVTSRDRTPLHALSSSQSGGNGLYLYSATGGFPTESYNATNYWVDVVYVDAASLPLQVSAVTPAAGATGVLQSAAPKALFSRTLDPASVSSSTVFMRDGANALVPTTVAYNATEKSVTLTPSLPLQLAQVYTVTLKGGATATHLTDASGTPLAADYTWSFTTAATAPVTTYSIWAPSATPANPGTDDDGSLELGLKFRSEISGYISGVRFYKGSAANGGAHVGHLWTTSGALLATVTFNNETASGWQQALFDTPIPVMANTTYVVSYFAPQGHYASDNNFFASAGVDNPPLHALSNAQGGGNGLYLYTSSGGFPTESYLSSNYWVDVVFVDGESLPLQVGAVTPAAGATAVPLNVAPKAVFSRSLDPASVNSSTVFIRNAANALVPSTVAYNATEKSVTLTPSQPLQIAQVYTVTLKGGGATPHLTDASGTPLAADYTWSFTTATTAPVTTYSIWASSATPANPDGDDGSSIELGVKFRSDISGYISGVRFYKGGAANGGTHVGHLWTSAGGLLGTVTFMNETASGWQQALFSAPIPVTANTTYVISYLAPQGHYSVDSAYFATDGVDNAPLHALSNAQAGGNGLYLYSSTGGFPTESFNSTNYWVDVVFIDENGIPLQVNSVTPSSGTNAVSVNVAPKAVFTKALDPASVSSSTVFLRDAGSALVATTVSYDAIEKSVTLTPQQPLQPAQTYTVTLKGGAAVPRLTDTLGGALTSDYTWSFTTAQTATSSTVYSIWGPAAVPTQPAVSDGTALELGLKFRADGDGHITGVRFYKGGVANGGTHTGHLWTSAGVLLGTATFTNETASGWQQALFSEPIAITGNTTYIVSYFAPQGRYPADNGYFASAGVDNAPLHALSNAQAGGNGVFRVGSSGFPTESFQSSNYWVDVTFLNSGAFPLQIFSVTPSPGATGLAGEITPTALFSKALDPTSVNASTAILRDAGNNQVPVTVSYNSSANKVTLTPQQPLQVSQTYTVTLKGGVAAPHIADSTGAPLPADYSWSFSTGGAGGPGGPILVITSAANKFTQYYPEILRAEGFNSYSSIDIAQTNSAILNQYDVVILGETPLSAAQTTMISNWVTAGGNLIAMRPDKQLAGLLGLSDNTATLSDAYLQVNTLQEPGAGITNQTIQYHSTADLYALDGASAVATLYSSVAQATSNPAVSVRSVGTSGGQAAAFAFDLARSIVYTRQGNPAFAGVERDGISPIRPNDQFFPDYLNLDKVAIPQADELQRLLANMILSMNLDKRPLPHFWYFPNMKKAVILMSGDDHSTPDGTKTTFNKLVAQSAPGCSIDDWECLRATSWVYTTSGLTNAEAQSFYNQGFDIGVHVTTGCNNWTPQSLDNYFTQDLAGFANKYTSLPTQTSNRTHCLVWSDWASHPIIELNHGIRLDANYYYWPGSWIQNRPGFMNGSGMPMRFADLDGSIIDVYQAATHLVNENGVDYPAGINSMLDKALGPEGYYGVFGTHYDYGDTFDDQLIASAKARNVSMITAKQLLTWIDGKNSSSFGATTWNGSVLSFPISIGSGANNLFTMIPNQANGKQVSAITVNGSPVTFTVETIKGRSYALFRAANGTVQATYTP